MTPSDYQIVLVKPAGFGPIEPFREVMESMQYGLQAHGYGAPIRENTIVPGATPILFGAHYLAGDVALRLPPDTIIYNLEQLAPGYPWFQAYYLDLLGRFRVWDYNAHTVNYLRAAGIARDVTHVPVGYAPCWTRIAEAPTEDVDVLFYGIQTPRRLRILQALGDAGLQVVALNNVWGKERDQWIARAKVVLNMHQTDDGTFEIVRVMFLQANRKAVVCECANPDEVNPDLRPGMAMAGYSALVDTCISLVHDELKRRMIADLGFVAVNAPGMQIARILEKRLGPQAMVTGLPSADAETVQPAGSAFASSGRAEHVAEELLRGNHADGALRSLISAVAELRRNPELAGKAVYLPALDHLVDRMGRRIAVDAGIAAAPAPRHGSLFIATELYATGGHTRLLGDIATHSESTTMVVMTDVFGNAASGRWRGEGVAALLGCLPLTLLPPGSLLDKVVALKRLIARLAPARIYLLAHHEDAVAYAACSGDLAIPTILIHHGDHNPALGATASNYVHVDVSRSVHALCSHHLGRPTLHLPLFVPDRGAKEFNYPLQRISTVTSGAPIKFVGEGGLAYHEIVADILSETSGRHFHIGMLPDAYIAHIRSHLAARGLAQDRFEHLPQVPSLWETLKRIDAQIYITSFPTGGLRAAAEAHGCGYPTACYLPAEDRPFLRHQADYAPATAFWHDSASLCRALRQLKDDHGKVAHAARQYYLENYSEQQFRRALAVIEQTG